MRGHTNIKCIDVTCFEFIYLNVHVRRMKQGNIKSLDSSVANILYFFTSRLVA